MYICTYSSLRPIQYIYICIFAYGLLLGQYMYKRIYIYILIYINAYICIYFATSTKQKKRRTTTGWRRLIGSPKLHIIFHKRATKCRSLLRKMTYKDEGSYESSPPCKQQRKTRNQNLNIEALSRTREHVRKCAMGWLRLVGSLKL